MSDPVFGSDDRVEGDLPPELQGKTPQQIAEYFMEREKKITQLAQDEIRKARTNQPPERPAVVPNAPPPNNPSTPPTQPTISINHLPEGARRTMVEGAKQLASAGKEHWVAYQSEIEAMMNNMSLEQQADSAMWETVYQNVIGRHAKEITDAAIKRATTMTSERSAPPSDPVPPQPLSPEQQRVVSGFGISDESYRKAGERIEKQEWPLTMNNQR